MTDVAVSPPPKLDPETLAIRSRPPRAIRFKRGVIIAIAAIGSVSLTAVTWMALSPHMLRHQEVQTDLAEPTKAPSDTLNGAPATYSDFPKLGPPLPGDLGKPILEHQRAEMAAVGPANSQVQQAEAAERERQLAELKAARESGVLVQGRQSGGDRTAAPIVTASATAEQPVAKLTLDPTSDPNAQGHKAAFVGALDPHGDVDPHTMTPVPSLYTLSAGSVISASLITGLHSDLPGLLGTGHGEHLR